MVRKRSLVPYSGSLVERMRDINSLSDLFSEFDNLWRSWDYDMKSFVDLQSKSSFPKVNIAETDDKYEIEVALAGFDKDDISLELKDNCLLIKADKQEEVTEEGEDKKYLMKEISSRSFRRAFQMPKKVLTDNIECAHKDGIITCVLTKEPPEVPVDDTVKIDIN